MADPNDYIPDWSEREDEPEYKPSYSAEDELEDREADYDN